jgi:hypothetical protein
MPLPIGTWSLNTGAFLYITAVNSDGSVEGNLDIVAPPGSPGNGPISGFFNESTQQLSFIGVSGASKTNVSSFAYLHATLFSYSLKLGISYLLAGDVFVPFEQGVDTSGEGSTWFAELYVPN